MQPSPQRKATDREDRRIVPGDLPQLFVALGIFADAVVSGFTGFAFSAVAGAVDRSKISYSRLHPLSESVS